MECRVLILGAVVHEACYMRHGVFLRVNTAAVMNYHAALRIVPATQELDINGSSDGEIKANSTHC